jgi:hypothetical protein
VIRIRFIDLESRRRAMLRTNNVDAVIAFATAMEQQGFEEVGLIRFWKHVLFGWGKRKKAAFEKSK